MNALDEAHVLWAACNKLNPVFTTADLEAETGLERRAMYPILKHWESLGVLSAPPRTKNKRTGRETGYKKYSVEQPDFVLRDAPAPKRNASLILAELHLAMLVNADATERLKTEALAYFGE